VSLERPGSHGALCSCSVSLRRSSLLGQAQRRGEISLALPIPAALSVLARLVGLCGWRTCLRQGVGDLAVISFTRASVCSLVSRVDATEEELCDDDPQHAGTGTLDADGDACI